jgi:hypothetical protein
LSRTPLNELLPDSSRGATAGRSHARLRHALLVVQVTMSIVLVLGAGLLTRSLLELTRIDLGFQTANVLTAQVQLPTSSYPDAESVVRFYRVLEERLQQIPGVRAQGPSASCRSRAESATGRSRSKASSPPFATTPSSKEARAEMYLSYAQLARETGNSVPIDDDRHEVRRRAARRGSIL